MAGVLRLMEVLEVTEPVEVMVAMQPREVAQATQAREVVVATELVEATESVEVMEPQVGILLLLLLQLVQDLEGSRAHGGTGMGSRRPQKNEACPWEVLEAAGGAPVGFPEVLRLVPEASGRSADLLCGDGTGCKCWCGCLVFEDLQHLQQVEPMEATEVMAMDVMAAMELVEVMEATEPEEVVWATEAVEVVSPLCSPRRSPRSPRRSWSPSLWRFCRSWRSSRKRWPRSLWRLSWLWRRRRFCLDDVCCRLHRRRHRRLCPFRLRFMRTIRMWTASPLSRRMKVSMWRLWLAIP